MIHECCFVCLEPTKEHERSKCQCRASVHDACLLKVVRARGDRECGICKVPIANVVVRRRVACQLTGTPALVFCFLLMGAALIGLSLAYLYMGVVASAGRTRVVLIGSACFFGAFGVVGFALVRRLYRHSGDAAHLVVWHPVFEMV